nr:venom gland protein U12-PHTX-Pmx1a [Physocyclus mexicanus]
MEGLGVFFAVLCLASCVLAQSSTRSSTGYDTTTTDSVSTHHPHRRVQHRHCTNSTDCAENECCVERHHLWKAQATCMPLVELGGLCHRDEDENQGVYMKRCPCEDGLVCILPQTAGAWPGANRFIPGNCENPLQETAVDSDDSDAALFGYGYK